MVILYFLRWFNIILFLRFLFQTGRLCTKLGFFIYYYLPYCYLHQTQENENVRSIKEGKIILKIALRLWSYVLDFFKPYCLYSLLFPKKFLLYFYYLFYAPINIYHPFSAISIYPIYCIHINFNGKYCPLTGIVWG